MRKTLMILVLLVFALPLSAYSVNTIKDSLRQDFPSSAAVIRKNQREWKRRIAKADVIHSEGNSREKVPVGMSLDNLKNYNKSVIKGTIYNLEKMRSPRSMAYTKASVHIDKVISGDKSLKDTIVYLALDGGLVSADDWYSEGRHKDYNHDMLVKNDEFPLPSIGAKIIAGLIPINLDEPIEFNNDLKRSGFTSKNSFAINTPQYNFWVKEPKAKKYRLNNPKLRKKNINGDYLAESLQQLTKEINKKYND
ncbi:hypothetical protein [Companilactobacillus sp. HBUAS56275]|uniref:Uncharacterized protein n=1 Tax=Candidatus Companilactobacillus pullicola TaxID=2838523 RepID=A0A9D2CNT8_9LACO|nr:hypothetical protein [Candidatus Companilactobacillus pullicola]